MSNVPPVQPVAEPPAAPAKAKTSGLAIASLVLGIAGPCTVGLGSIIGLILGIVGLVKIGRSAGAKGGRGLAIAGIVVSGLGILILPVLVGMAAAILMPAVYSAMDMANATSSVHNVKQLCTVAQVYATSHDQHLPPADSWPQVFQEQMGLPADVMADPADQQGGRAYAMNAGLNGSIAYPDVGRTVLFFECKSGAPPAGGPDLLPDKPRHAGRYVIGFLDGHVESVAPEEVRRLIWQPRLAPESSARQAPESGEARP
jgi:prepilin-type processing-associated H-X9-DG protein